MSVRGLIVILLWGCCGAAVPQQPAAEMPELIMQQPVTRQISAGATHAYTLHANANDLLHIELDQQGIDLILTLRDPAGAVVAEADIPNVAQEEETIVLVTAAAGAYRLEVAPRYPTFSGRYLLALKLQRPAQPGDSVWAKAEHLQAQAQLLRRKGALADFRAAIPLLEQSLAAWRELGNPSQEAKTRYFLCSTYRYAGEYEAGRNACFQALALAQSIPAPRYAWRSLNLLGLMAVDKNQVEQSIAYFQQAIEEAKPLGGPQTIGPYVNMALQWQRLANNEQTRYCFQKSLEILARYPDPTGEALLYHTMLMFYRWRGDYEKAQEYGRKAAELRRLLGDKRGQGRTLSELYAILRDNGEYEEAARLLQEATRLSRETNDSYYVWANLRNLALLMSDLGRYPEALAYCDQLDQIEGSQMWPGKHSARAYAYRQMGRLTEARVELALELQFLQQRGDNAGETLPRILYKIALLDEKQGRIAEACANLEQAIKLQEEAQARFRNERDLLLAARNLSQFSTLYIDLLMRQGKPETEQLALQIREGASARVLLALLAEVRQNIHKGVSPALLAQEKQVSAALAQESARQTQLIFSNQATPAQLNETEQKIRQLSERYSEVKALIRASSPAYAALTQPRALSVEEIQAHLDDDTMLLEYALGPQRSYVWAVTRDAVKSYTLPAAQDINTAARRVYASWQPAPSGKFSPDNTAAENLSRMILAPLAENPPPAIKKLVIVADGALHYIPFAALPLLSEAQILSTRYEVVNLPSMTTLAALRQQLRGRAPAPRALAVFADPVFDDKDARVYARAQDQAGRAQTPATARLQQAQLANAARGAGVRDGSLARLLASRREAEALAQIVVKAGGVSLKKLDFDASRELFLSGELAQYRYLHFATHGLLNTAQPELSGLVFSLVDAQGQPQNGFVRLHDIYNLELNADLVVLSACQTGLGQEVRGEGLIGLTRGFMYAGAERVVASLWQVDDQATAALMRYFYTALLRDKKTPPAALRQAQMQMQRHPGWRAPYYWAAFVVQGEWR